MLSIRPDSDEPLADQIVRGLRAALARGELKPGAELPPVRQLAADLGINLNTVARAYRSLQQAGLVHTARGRGTHVTAAIEVPGESKEVTKTRFREAVVTVVADAKLSGLDRSDAKQVIEAQFDELWPPTSDEAD